MLHDAPAAFQFPVSRSVRAGFFVSALCLAAAGVLLGWSWPILATGFAWQYMVMVGALLVWLMASAQAFRQWRTSPRGRLLWQGHAWAWQESHPSLHPVPKTVPIPAFECVWDGQSFLLLRVQWAQARRRQVHWLCVERSMSPALWSELRRAVLYWRRHMQKIG